MNKHILKLLALLQHSKQKQLTSHPNQQSTLKTPEEWRTYWQTQGQPWRTEPEIDVERQKYLAQRRAITPVIEKGIYPFKGIKLNRADIEWLLATHEELGPVDWSDKNQRERWGLDLRGADLSQENLSDLPLARIRCWITRDEWYMISKEPSLITPALMKEANLFNAHLEGADLRAAHLEGAYLHDAHLEGAQLRGAHLEGANLRRAKLQEATLYDAHLQGADLTAAHLEGAILYRAQLDGVDLKEAALSDEKYGTALLADVRWGEINLAVVDWKPVKMLGDERQAREPKKIRAIRLNEYRDAVRANRQLATVLRDQGLTEVADRFAYRAQMLQRKALLMQARWGQVKLLKEKQKENEKGLQEEMEKQSSMVERLQMEKEEMEKQSSMVERLQMEKEGIQKELQQMELWNNKIIDQWRRLQKFVAYVFSWFLNVLAGYGYRPARSGLWYLVILFGFAMAYYTFGHLPLLPDAFVFSLTSFHGRGFFPGLGSETSLHNPLVVLAAFEAVVGLFIEISFIATFTQRFFGK